VSSCWFGPFEYAYLPSASCYLATLTGPPPKHFFSASEGTAGHHLAPASVGQYMEPTCRPSW